MFGRIKFDYPSVVIGFIIYSAIRMVDDIGATTEATEVTFGVTLRWCLMMVGIFYGGYYQITSLHKGRFVNETNPEGKKKPFHIDLATGATGFIMYSTYEMFMSIGTTHPSFVTRWEMVAEWLLTSLLVFLGGRVYAKRQYNDRYYRNY